MKEKILKDKYNVIHINSPLCFKTILESKDKEHIKKIKEIANHDK